MKSFHATPLAVLSLLVASLTACSDEMLNEESMIDGSSISFKTSETNNGIVSRSAAYRTFTSFTCEKIENSDNYLITTEEEGSDFATFGAQDSETASRGTVISGNSHFVETYGQYSMFAYVYDNTAFGQFKEAIGNAKQYIINATVTPKANGEWNTGAVCYWTNNAQHNIAFFGVAPSSIDDYDISYEFNLPDDTHSNGELTRTAETQPGYIVNGKVEFPYIEYVVPTDNTKQKDIMVASREHAGNANVQVNMNFKHIVSVVKVKTTDENIAKKVKKVSIVGVKRAGRYYLGDDCGWHLADNTETFTLDITEPLSYETTETSDGTAVQSNVYAIADGDNTFLMLPQVLGEDAHLEIVLDEGNGNTRTLTHSITDKEWAISKSYTYYITDTPALETYTLEVVDQALSFSTTAETKETNVRSYKTRYAHDGSVEGIYPVKWEGTLSYDRTEEDSTITSFGQWISSYTLSGNGVNDEGAYEQAKFTSTTVDASAQTTSDDTTLKAAPQFGNACYPYDLSTFGGKTCRNTANCYVINGPGVYAFPLVYGNAIKNGKVNLEAFNMTAAVHGKAYGLEIFAEHDNRSIKSPWLTALSGIKGYTPNGIKVLWQDAQGLISESSLKFSCDHNFVIFEITRDQIKAGNAVIGVYDKACGGDMLWSWHIWVTPYKLGDSFVVDNIASAKTGARSASRFMSVPLGYVKQSESSYPERWANYDIQQYDEVDGKKVYKQTANVVLQQTEVNSSPATATYYQWGRKDPFPGAAFSADTKQATNVQCYTGSGSAYEMKVVNAPAKTLGTAICNPTTFYAGGVWFSGPQFFNLWGSVGNGNKTTAYKTIYDPCPVGFQVPPVDAFPALTVDGANHSSGSDYMSPRSGSEFALLRDIVNTKFRSHEEIEENFGFTFFTKRMPQPGVKAKSCTFTLPALGMRLGSQQLAAQANKSVGDMNNIGSHFYFYSATQAVDCHNNTATFFIHGGYKDGNCGVYPNAYTASNAGAQAIWPIASY